LTLLPIMIGAAAGAPARYLTDRAVQSRHDSVFPWGTFIVNLAGSALLGFLAALSGHPGAMTVTGIGFCGAFTTYSTFSYETLKLVQDRAYLFAALNAAASIIGGLGAAYVGMAMAQAVIT
jgi:fluoride exporter